MPNRTQRDVVVVAMPKPEVADFVARSLEEAGYDVVTVCERHRAFWTTLEIQPDLVLCDVALGTDGSDLVQRLRSCDETAQVPVLLFSGQDALGDAVVLGAGRYVSKPIGPDELARRVGYAIRLGRSRPARVA